MEPHLHFDPRYKSNLSIDLHKLEKIILFGGAGFMGNSLAKHFSNLGLSVIVADTSRRLEKYTSPAPHIEYVTTEWPNLPGLLKLQNADAVVHLAWNSNPSSSMNNIEKDASDNILGTIKLLEQVAALNVKKFLFMSSGGTVYGNAGVGAVSETDPTHPISPYGISKLACESYVSHYATRYGFSPICVRLGNPYGPYQLSGTPVGVIANFVRKIIQQETIDLYGRGETIRDYIHIDDCTNAIEKLLHTSTAKGTFNLGSGVGRSTSSIIEIIEKATRSNAKINHLESRRSDVRSIVLDSTKIQQQISCVPKVSLNDGIADMVSSFEDELIGQKFKNSLAG